MFTWRDENLNVIEPVPVDDTPITHLWQVAELPGSMLRGSFCIPQGSVYINKVHLLIPSVCAVEMNRIAASAITEIMRHHPGFVDRAGLTG